LTDVRQNLAAPRPVAKQEHSVNLSELLSGIQLTTVEQVKSVLSNLQVTSLEHGLLVLSFNHLDILIVKF